jgi:hypothetical protein
MVHAIVKSRAGYRKFMALEEIQESKKFINRNTAIILHQQQFYFMKKITTSIIALIILTSSIFLTNIVNADLSAAQKSTIGKKIWHNESGGTVNGLTAWNDGEKFPSFGIGHFIWYPSNYTGPFTESWPQFIAFAKKQGANPPPTAMLADCPWNSKKQFTAEFNGSRLIQIRKWLAANVNLQTEFIIAKSKATLPKIINAAPANDRGRIEENYKKVASTTNGTYALIDYINFKGDGLNSKELYNGKGWGLLQVLGGMKESVAGQSAAAEFSASAKRALDRRIKNSPPARGENRWREGWMNRCATYAKSL